MRFLVDQPVSAQVAEGLRAAGHDARHVRDYRMSAATDPEIFDLAARERRTIISVDTDFGTILAARTAREPSFILFRKEATQRPDQQLDLLLKNLPKLEEHLITGSIVVFDGFRVRARRLPLLG